MKIQKTLHVGSPNIGEKALFQKYVDEIFNRRWLTNHGEVVQEFESELSKYLGVKHCITMCNGTVALEIAIRALGLSGEVLVPSMTFIATAHALQWQEIRPVFCDIDRNTYNIDYRQLEKHVTPNTSGIIGVHLYGRPCDVENLNDFSDSHGLNLMFDAAHAFGCTYKGKKVGNFGDCEVFSFHATKFFNTFEGGAITTNNDELAHKIRLMQNFGFHGLDNVVYIGTNGKMNEISAAMGLVNLRSIEKFMNINKSNYEIYKKGLSQITGLDLMAFDDSEICNRQYIVVNVGDKYPLSRDFLIKKLHKENILARRYFWPGCHKMEPYRSLQPNAGLLLPVTEEISEKLIVLPTGTSVNKKEINMILEVLQ